MPDKKVVHHPLPEEGDLEAGALYEMLQYAVAQWHPDLAEARIVLVWRTEWKPDQDGRLKIGECKIVPELERELHGYDVEVLLNKEVFTNADLTRQHKLAVMDHELSHVTPAIDNNGDEKRDEKNRIVYRKRAHEVEEFLPVLNRHGCYTSELERLAAVMAERSDMPLFADQIDGDEYD